jgi:hypothetical protein
MLFTKPGAKFTRRFVPSHPYVPRVKLIYLSFGTVRLFISYNPSDSELASLLVGRISHPDAPEQITAGVVGYLILLDIIHR